MDPWWNQYESSSCYCVDICYIDMYRGIKRREWRGGGSNRRINKYQDMNRWVVVGALRSFNASHIRDLWLHANYKSYLNSTGPSVNLQSTDLQHGTVASQLHGPAA